jgi:hypothetical protein
LAKLLRIPNLCVESATAAVGRSLPTKIWHKIGHFQHLPEVCVRFMKVGFGLPAQPIDATHALKRSAGV